MRRLLLFLCLVLAVVVGGCGGGASSDGADPTELIPADAAVYLEAVIRPEGDQEEAARSVAGKLMRTEDPGAKIRELVDKAMRESGRTDGSFEKDIDPWLGDKVGLALSDLQGEEPRFIAVIAAKDEELATDQLAQQAQRDKSRKASSGDVEYWVDPDGEVAGVFGGAVVVASDEKSFKDAIAAEDGPNLAESKVYEQALEDLPEDRIGTFFVDTPRFFDAVKAQPGTDPSAGPIIDQFAKDAKPMAGAALVTDNTISIETVTAIPKGVGNLFGISTGGQTPLVRELPGDAWGATGAADLGPGAKTLLGQLGGALGGAAIAGQLEQQLGINLDEDVFGWIGDAAVFVRGDTINTLEGGAVIEVTDATRAKNAIPKLVGLARQQGGAPFEPTKIEGASLAFSAALPGAPRPLVVALGDERAVITYGEEAATDALNRTEAFGDSDLYARAKEAADGLEPTFLLDAKPILNLVKESMPADDEDFKKALPYLESLDLLAGGSEKDDGKLRQRFALRVR